MGLRAILAGVCAGAVALGLGLTAAAAGGGAKVLRAELPSSEVFLVNGVSKVFTFTCNEHRVQRPDGSARDTAHCVLNANQTPPRSAAHGVRLPGYVSDFFIAKTPGFAGRSVTTDWHGVVTPSGRVTMVAEFAAP